MAKKELTEAQKAQKALEAEVKKNIRRIKRFVKSAEKRGYSFSENVIPTLPKSGITAGTLRKVQKITPKTLYKKAVYTTETGNRIKGTKARKLEQKQVAERAAKTRRARQILKTVRRMIDSWAPKPQWNKTMAQYKERDKNILESVLDGAIAELGEDQVALNMEEQADKVVDLVDSIIYGESGRNYFIGGRERVNMKIARFAAIIRNKMITVQESKEYSEGDEYGEDGEDYE